MNRPLISQLRVWATPVDTFVVSDPDSGPTTAAAVPTPIGELYGDGQPLWATDGMGHGDWGR